MPKKRIWNIVAHRENPILAANFWKRNNFCAFGTIKYTEFSESDYDCRNFLDMSKGDLVFLYTKHKTIAYIGEVADDRIRYVDKDLPSYVYFNRRRVDWWDEPRYVRVDELLPVFTKQIPKPHRSVSPVEYPGFTFTQIKGIFRNLKSASGLESLPEDTIHNNLMKIMRLSSDDIEPGLTIAEAEKGTNRGDRPDFIAVDKSDRDVIIECKVTATLDDLDQVLRYSRNYRDEHRLMLVAYSIPSEVALEAHRQGIECFQCKMKYSKL